MTEETPKKRTPLWGPASSRIKALDKGLQRTLESTIKRWLKNRIELLETLPDDTRAELDEAGLLQTPTPTLPNMAPKKTRAQSVAPARGWPLPAVNITGGVIRVDDDPGQQ